MDDGVDGESACSEGEDPGVGFVEVVDEQIDVCCSAGRAPGHVGATWSSTRWKDSRRVVSMGSAMVTHSGRSWWRV